MNPSFPLVTVLMPCKLVKVSFFREALNSVFSQSRPLWNLIVIYDVSDNLETTVLKELGNSKDNRVSVLKNESKLITGALNTGMKHATTPYVCSLHCDDLLDENAIELLNSYISEYPDIDYYHSSRIHIDEDGHTIGSIKRARESFNPSDFKNHDAPVKHLHCWKVESALAIGGMDESLGLHVADDYDFPWCMAEAGYSFKAIPKCLYYYRDHREHYRLTTHVPLETQINELKKIWKKHGLTDEEIEEQIEMRTSGYLKQALYLDEEDKKRKEGENYDIRKSWREKHG